MLVQFLAKRVVVLAAAIAAACFILDGFSFIMPLGVGLGAFVSLYKTRLNSRVLESAVHAAASPVKNMLIQLLSQLLSLALLVVAALANLHLFIGVGIGLLLVPFFICVNAVTERVGLTHNAWGGG